MRCITSGYDLQELPNPACPECGREFDPNDPDTFLSTTPARPSVARHVVGFTVPIAIVCGGFIAIRLAVQYSRWEAVPLILLSTLVASSAACLYSGSRFAASVADSAGGRAASCLVWLLSSALLAWFGLRLVDLLPFTVGDGP